MGKIHEVLKMQKFVQNAQNIAFFVALCANMGWFGLYNIEIHAATTTTGPLSLGIKNC